MATTATIPAIAAQNSLVLANKRVSRRRRGSTNVSVVVPRTSVAVPGARSVMLMIVLLLVGVGRLTTRAPTAPKRAVETDVVSHDERCRSEATSANHDSVGTEWG